jgi:competence protein ComEA
VDPKTEHPWRAIEAPVLATDPPSGPAEPIAAGPSERGPAITVPAEAARWAAAGLGVVACLLVAAWLALSSGSDGVVLADVDPSGPGDGVGSAASAGPVVVEIVGAVARPGVYRLPAGARVADLVAAAGGYGPRVDTARVAAELDLASSVPDGARIRVPARGDPSAQPAASGGAGGGSAGSGPLDLTTATADQLDTLPGIGPVTAAKILAARDEAPFSAVDDLRSRGVLGEKTFERIRDLVTVP